MCAYAPWKPDCLEESAVRTLTLPNYVLLKKYLYEAWVPRGPTRREKAFFFANIATLHKLAQAHAVIRLFAAVGYVSSGGLSGTWRPVVPPSGSVDFCDMSGAPIPTRCGWDDVDISGVPTPGQSLPNDAGSKEAEVRLLLSAAVTTLRSAFDCLSCELYLLFAPRAKERCLDDMSLGAILSPKRPYRATLEKAAGAVIAELDAATQAPCFQELAKYRNNWTHRETAYLACLPGAYFLLRPDLDLALLWDLVSHAGSPRNPSTGELSARGDVIEQLSAYVTESCSAINELWRLVHALVRCQGFAAKRLDFAP